MISPIQDHKDSIVCERENTTEKNKVFDSETLIQKLGLE